MERIIDRQVDSTTNSHRPGCERTQRHKIKRLWSVYSRLTGSKQTATETAHHVRGPCTANQSTAYTGPRPYDAYSSSVCRCGGLVRTHNTETAVDFFLTTARGMLRKVQTTVCFFPVSCGLSLMQQHKPAAHHNLFTTTPPPT